MRLILFSLLLVYGECLQLEDVQDAVSTLQSIEHKNAYVENRFSFADELAQKESELLKNGQYLTAESPFFKMAQFKKTSIQARELAKKARKQLEITKLLKNKLELNKVESGEGLRQLTSSFTIINDTCLSIPTCTTSKYRTNDGSCNSLSSPNLGKSNTVYRRLLTPDYADGIESPRAMQNGSDLPNARYISANVFDAGDRPLPISTLAVMQFGQLINHDFQQSSQFSFSNGSAISCCSSNWQSLNASELHPACLPISIAIDDPFINPSGQNITCMNFVRSVAGPRLDCSLGYADQINQNTHWLDASTVYGSSDDVSVTLRAYSYGLLLTSRDTANNRDLLPVTSSCTTGACFIAGDSRVTEQPGLAVMHTLWMREHNRIAKALYSLNPTWNDETLFQEARRIVIAEMQHITYNEFLPVILDSTTITKYGLAPLSTGFFTNYTSVSSGPVSNEFATAAFRMGHSLVQGSVLLYDENGSELNSSYSMVDTFNDASKIFNDATFLDSVVRGLLTQPSQSVDRSVVKDLWNLLFRELPRRTGFDIVALNIQRGRDHGLPSYNSFRGYCGLSKFSSLSDLSTGVGTSSAVFTAKSAQLLSTYYSSVEDIDLYSGGLNEITSKTGGIVGPTFACLIGEHFSNIKYSDRFFYELGGQSHSFSSAQLAEIRKASLSRIFCDNTDGSVKSVQAKAFVAVSSSTNPKVSCSDTTKIPQLDLSQWKNEPLY